MIEEDLYTKMSNSEVKTVFDNEAMDFVINLELLNGCAHACTGCFVNRKNEIVATDVKKAYQLAKDLTEKGLRFREVIISPTDIFSASNTDEILLNKDFQAMLKLNDKTRITTTAMFYNTPMSDIERVFALLDNPAFFRPNMIMEFLVPMEADKVLNHDEDYFEQNIIAIDFFKTQTTKIVDWSFVVNIHHDQVLVDNFEKISKIVCDEYDGIIEFLPSFFRTGNTDLIEKHLGEWKEFLSASVNADNYKDLMITIADMHHNSFNTIVMNYRRGELYLSPFIYEQILMTHTDLHIENPTAESVFAKIQEQTVAQYHYAEITDECQTCEYFTTCVGRNVLSFMEAKDIQHCIYPKDVLSLYTNIPAKIPHIETLRS